MNTRAESGMAEPPPPPQSVKDCVHKTKLIRFLGRTAPIVIRNDNGPGPLLAICHFFPEEDDKFLERVRAAVEEDEHQAILAADMDAARDAIATAEQSRKTTETFRPDSMDQSSDKGESKESKGQTIPSTNEGDSTAVTKKDSGKQVLQGEGYSELMMLWQTYLLNFITSIMAAILIWAALLR